MKDYAVMFRICNISACCITWISCNVSVLIGETASFKERNLWYCEL